MAAEAEQRLRGVLKAATALAEPTSGPPKRPSGGKDKETLGTVLGRRIAAFRVQADGLDRLASSEEVRAISACGPGTSEADKKELTATLALRCIEEVVSILRSPSLPSSSSAPPLGSRDSKVLQMLAGIVAKWGVAAQVEQGILPPSLREKQPRDARVREVSSDDDQRHLTRTAERLFAVVSPTTSGGVDMLNPMRALVLPSVFVPLVAALLQLGYGQDSLRWARTSLQSLLETTAPGTVFPALLLLLSSSRTPTSPDYVHKTIAVLLSQRLLLPGGVRAFLHVVVGASEDTHDPPLARLEAALNVLRRPPSDTSPDRYFSHIVPPLLDIVAPGFDASAHPVKTPAPPGLVKAACFVLGQFLVGPEPTARSAVSSRIHAPFLATADQISSSVAEDGLDPVVVSSARIGETTALLTTLLVNADPSPTLHSAVVASILPGLLSLWLYLHQTRADPVVREEIQGLMAAWVRTGGIGEVAERVRRSLEVLEQGEEFRSRGMAWARDSNGGGCVRKRGDAEGETDEDGEMQLKPDPEAFVEWLSTLKQEKVAGKLLVAWLSELEVLRMRSGFHEAKRTLLRMQLVGQMVDRLDSAILEDPANILEFVKHAIAPAERGTVGEPTKPRPTPKRDGKGVGLADLKIVEVDDGEVEDDDGEAAFEGHEMLLTGLSLLSSVLEANPALSPSNTPSLHGISERLDVIIHDSSSAASEAALQCRMLLAVRLAADRANAHFDSAPYPSTTAKKAGSSSAVTTYREALKLLEDPILPVRAQGLNLLRSLLVRRQGEGEEIDPALVPGVLDIFLQAVQDDDSFLYLNAVKGLGEMAERYVDLVAPRLAVSYGREDASFAEFGAGLGGAGGEGTTKELDKRLRVGEAMSQVIQRSGSALPIYLSRFLPPLLHVLRTPTYPAVLRSSAITLLGHCAASSPLAMAPHVHAVVDACLTLLSIESSKAKPPLPPRPDENDGEGPGAGEGQKWRLTKMGGPIYEETPSPASTDSSHPALRRSAILFLRDFLLASTSTPDQAPVTFPPEILKRAHAVLAYVAATDADGLVRYQAASVAEEVELAAGPLLIPSSS